MNLAIEKTSSGSFRAITKDIEVFEPSMTWSNISTFAFDIIINVCLFLMILAILWDMKHMKRHNDSWSKRFATFTHLGYLTIIL